MDGDAKSWGKKHTGKVKYVDVRAPTFISQEYALFSHSLQAWRGAQGHAALTGSPKDYEHARILYQITMERFRFVQARNAAEHEHLRTMRDTIAREVHIARGRQWPPSCKT